MQRLAREYRIPYIRTVRDFGGHVPLARRLAIKALSRFRNRGTNDRTIGVANAGHLDTGTILDQCLDPLRLPNALQGTPELRRLLLDDLPLAVEQSPGFAITRNDVSVHAPPDLKLPVPASTRLRSSRHGRWRADYDAYAGRAGRETAVFDLRAGTLGDWRRGRRALRDTPLGSLLTPVV